MGFRLVVDDKEVELTDAVKFVLDIQRRSFRNISENLSNRSISFDIEDTNVNKPIFGYLDNISITSTPYKRIKAELFNNNTRIDKGFIQIISKSGSKIKCNYSGGSADWYKYFKDLLLTNLNVTELNHTYTPANIIASFGNNWEDGYKYHVVDYGNLFNRSTNIINTDEIYPATFVKYLIRKVFEKNGVKVKGTGWNDPRFEKLILPFARKSFLNTEENQNNFVRAELSATFNALPTESIFPANIIKQGNENGLYNTGTYKYTADVDIEIFEYRIRVKGGGSPMPLGLTFIIKKNGVQVDSFTRTISGSRYYTYDFVNKPWMQLLTSDYLEVFVKSVSAFLSVPLSSISYVIIQSSPKFFTGSTVSLKETFAKLKLEELLKYCAFNFNWVFNYDNFKEELTINKFDDLQSNIKNALDWSDKVDGAKSIDVEYTELVSDYKVVNIIKYAQDETTELTDKELSYGSGVFYIDNDFIPGDNELIEFEFAGTILSTTNDGNSTLPYIRRFDVGNSEPQHEPKPRILIDGGNVLVASISNFDEYNILGGVTDIIPFMYFSKPITGIPEIDGQTFTLAFNHPNIYSIGDSILESDYKTVVDLLNRPLLINVFLFLNEKDVSLIDFSIPIKLSQFNSNFYINKISQYDFKGNSVKVELIRLL